MIISCFPLILIQWDVPEGLRLIVDAIIVLLLKTFGDTSALFAGCIQAF